TDLLTGEKLTTLGYVATAAGVILPVVGAAILRKMIAKSADGADDLLRQADNLDNPTGAGGPPNTLFDDLPDPDGPMGIGVRVLHPNQYNLAGINPGVIIRNQEQISNAIGDALQATGTHSNVWSGLYSFMRHGGGAGFLGV